MKSYQFFKICKRFDKERENTYAAVNEKKKTEKSWILFYNRLFYKSFNVKIFNHLFVLEPHSQPNFYFLISGWRKKYQKEK